MLSTALPPQLVLAGSTLYASQGTIYGLNTTTGKVHRQHAVSGIASLACARRTLYLNVSRHPDALVQAVRTGDGSLLWSYQVEGRLAQAPTLAEHGVYVSTAEGSIYALRARTGTLLWCVNVASDVAAPSSFVPIVYTAPLLIKNRLYIAFVVNQTFDAFLVSFHVKDGRRLWQTPLPDASSFPLTAADDRIFLSTARGCAAIDRHDGSLLWHQEPGSGVQVCSSPVVADDRVHVSLSVEEAAPDEMKHEPQALLCALRARDGSLLWQQAIGGTPAARRPTAVALIDEVLCVGANNGFLSAYRSADGTPLWSSRLSGTLLSPPLGAAGRVYIGDHHGTVSAFRVRDGLPLWQTALTAEVQSTAHLSILSGTSVVLPPPPPRP